MSLLMNPISVSDSTSERRENESKRINKEHDEMTLVMKTTNTQTSSMPEVLKKEKRDDAPSLEEILKNTVEAKGEIEEMKSSWTSEDALEIEGISQMTLHSFLLKAEELGKNITYTRTLKVEIKD